jgi:hypothetical protein
MVVMNCGTQDKFADYGISIDSESGRDWRVAIIFQPFRQGDDISLSLPCHSIDGNGRYYVDWSEKHSILGKPELALDNGTSAPRRHLSPPCMICHPPTQRLLQPYRG